MRDGIYKNLPLPLPWKRLLRACGRDADRGERCRELAVDALYCDIQEAMTPSFSKKFKAATERSESLLECCSAFDAEISSRSLDGQNSPLQNEIIANARRLEQCGVRGLLLEKEALALSVSEQARRRSRQLEQTVLVRSSGGEAREDVTAIRDALSPGVEAIVGGRVAGPMKKGVPARRQIQLDEDIGAAPIAR